MECCCLRSWLPEPSRQGATDLGHPASCRVRLGRYDLLAAAPHERLSPRSEPLLASRPRGDRNGLSVYSARSAATGSPDAAFHAGRALAIAPIPSITTAAPMYVAGSVALIS